VRTGRILTARRRSELLGAAASCDGELPVITPPDGCAASGPGQGTDGRRVPRGRDRRRYWCLNKTDREAAISTPSGGMRPRFTG